MAPAMHDWNSPLPCEVLADLTSPLGAMAILTVTAPRTEWRSPHDCRRPCTDATPALMSERSGRTGRLGSGAGPLSLLVAAPFAFLPQQPLPDTRQVTSSHVSPSSPGPVAPPAAAARSSLAAGLPGAGAAAGVGAGGGALVAAVLLD